MKNKNIYIQLLSIIKTEKTAIVSLSSIPIKNLIDSYYYLLSKFGFISILTYKDNLIELENYLITRDKTRKFSWIFKDTDLLELKLKHKKLVIKCKKDYFKLNIKSINNNTKFYT